MNAGYFEVILFDGYQCTGYMNLTRVFDIISFQHSRYPNQSAIVDFEDGNWKSYSSLTCQQQINSFSRILYALGLRKGDRIVIMPKLTNRKWLFLDLAAQQIGSVVIPIHASFNTNQINHILNETEARIVFLSSIIQRERIENNGREVDIYYLQGKGNNNLEELIIKYSKSELPDLKALKEGVKPKDVATIIYTSGTTGEPKGVMLTHENLMSNLHSLMPLLPVDPSKRAISFLPYSHIFERSAIYTYLAMGCSLHLVGDKGDMLAAFQKVKPHFFTAVPRILEKIYEGVLAYQAKQNFVNKKIIHWALKVGGTYEEQHSFRPFYALKKKIAKLIAFNKLHKILGGKVEAVIIGAAYLQPKLAKLFATSGIKIREGYGMTETSPAIAFNRFQPGLNRFGTVGLPVPGVQVKIHEPDAEGAGEIWVKGNNVMKGYYKKEEATQAVFSEDGWFKTGDVGKFVEQRFLQITDRKKDIFKTSAGKYVAPQLIENHFTAHPLIDQMMVIGFQKPFCTALIKPNFLLLEQWANDQQVHWTSPQYMVINIKVKEKMQQIVDALNEAFPNHQKIRKFHLLFKEWTLEGGELSYTMKLIRPRILESYEKEIEELYAV